MIDALAQLSMSRGPASVHSRSVHSMSSDLYIPSPGAASDMNIDSLSLQTFGTAATVC